MILRHISDVFYGSPFSSKKPGEQEQKREERLNVIFIYRFFFANSKSSWLTSPRRPKSEFRSKEQKFLRHWLLCRWQNQRTEVDLTDFWDTFSLFIMNEVIRCFHQCRIFDFLRNICYGTIIYFFLIIEEFVIRVISFFGGWFCHSASQRRTTNLAFLKEFSGIFKKKPNLQHV